MTHHTPCPSHPGIYTDTRPCYRCPQPEEVPVDDATVTVLEQAARRLKDTNLSAVPDTAEVVDQTADRVANLYAPMQPTLDDTLFPPVRKSDTPMVKVTISGTVELTQADYLAFLDGSRIGPGAVVEIRAAGYVVQPGAAWVKRTEGSGEDKQTWHEREGRIKVKLTDLAGFAATGEEWSE